MTSLRIMLQGTIDPHSPDLLYTRVSAPIGGVDGGRILSLDYGQKMNRLEEMRPSS